MQCYSVRGLSVVAAFNIANTIANLFNVVFIALGDSVAIVVGQRLGAGQEVVMKARDLGQQDDRLFCDVLYRCCDCDVPDRAAVSTAV